MGKSNYADNMYAWLKRKGFAPKYEHAGIYCIKIDGEIVYIGKSVNMLKRVSQHYVGIKTGSEKKYRIMAEAQRRGRDIEFDVLYYAQSTGHANQLAEIGKKEGEYIRHHRPILNTQIPKAEDWNKWDIQTVDADSILKNILT